MTFKKSSMPMVLAALLCIAVGIGIIVFCFIVPTSGSDDGEKGNEIVNIGNEIPEKTPDETENQTEVPDNTENDPDISDPVIPSDPVNDEPQQGEVSEPEIPDEPSVSENPTESSEPEEPTIPSAPENSFVSSKDDPLLILANVDNPLPDDFEVGELETVQGNYKLDVRAASYARDMIAAAKADGITLQLCSSYRAKSLQQTLFDNKYEYYISNGWNEADAYAKTATIIAIPGTSEHQTGLCMDVVTPSYQVLDAGYAETDAAKWLAENAWDYGFILRYPKDKQEITKIIFEPWHYRFVGVENAKLIKESGLCLEEYLETLE